MVKHFSCYDVIKFNDLIAKQITKASGDNLSLSDVSYKARFEIHFLCDTFLNIQYLTTT